MLISGQGVANPLRAEIFSLFGIRKVQRSSGSASDSNLRAAKIIAGRNSLVRLGVERDMTLGPKGIVPLKPLIKCNLSERYRGQESAGIRFEVHPSVGEGVKALPNLGTSPWCGKPFYGFGLVDSDE